MLSWGRFGSLSMFEGQLEVVLWVLCCSQLLVWLVLDAIHCHCWVIKGRGPGEGGLCWWSLISSRCQRGVGARPVALSPLMLLIL